jgi:short subunit dehydrogenase-like uncharacterized protein
MSRIDIVLFGATGFTGNFVARELAKACCREDFTWAIAGRSQSKLESVLASICSEGSGKVETLVVDVSDEQSILNMCQKARIVINCVGPVSWRMSRNCVEWTQLLSAAHFISTGSTAKQ